mmetsp:Transcript_79042/g.164175  ORF Transcript_79042/g.164175 Transcript_79042/m.164175 type:complete len:85 (+) Transcript_79042:873-1127(+)
MRGGLSGTDGDMDMSLIPKVAKSQEKIVCKHAPLGNESYIFVGLYRLCEHSFLKFPNRGSLSVVEQECSTPNTVGLAEDVKVQF